MDAKAGYSKNPNLIDKEVEDGLLLFDTDSGKMVELNPTAKKIWQGTGNSFSIDELKKIIEESYEEAENVDADLDEFVNLLVKRDLVTKNGKS